MATNTLYQITVHKKIIYDDADKFFEIINTLEHGWLSNSHLIIDNDRRRLIDYVYKIYRKEPTNIDIINVSVDRNNCYSVYFRNINYSFNTLTDVKQFLQERDCKFEIISLEIVDQNKLDPDQILFIFK